MKKDQTRFITGYEDIKLYIAQDASPEISGKIAASLNTIPIRDSKPTDDEIALSLTSKGLALIGDGLSFIGDYSDKLSRLKKNNLSGELLVKAARIKDTAATPIAIDATAGMGEDSLLLAAAGFTVHMIEYNPVIAELLKDTIRRAAEIPELAGIVERMIVHAGDSTRLMTELNVSPDVILLDPMFPERTKSALIKKKFQLFHHLEKPCTDEAALLKAAYEAHPHKIVIKRPLKGPVLAGYKPSYSISGKAIRYDCIVIPR